MTKYKIGDRVRMRRDIKTYSSRALEYLEENDYLFTIRMVFEDYSGRQNFNMEETNMMNWYEHQVKKPMPKPIEITDPIENRFDILDL